MEKTVKAGVCAVDLCKSYQERLVLKGISFTLEEGMSLVIQGPSGSGKSTLLRLLAGLERPDAGEVWSRGKLVNSPRWAEAPWKRNIGMVFQAPLLWPHMTVAENIAFPISSWPAKKRKARVDELLGLLDIADQANRYPDEISGGQARRTSLARAMAARPAFLLLDEPLTNLNIELKSQLLHFIREEAQKTGATMIFVTHDPEEANLISDNRLCLYAGECLLPGEYTVREP